MQRRQVIDLLGERAGNGLAVQGFQLGERSNDVHVRRVPVGAEALVAKFIGEVPTYRSVGRVS